MERCKIGDHPYASLGGGKNCYCHKEREVKKAQLAPGECNTPCPGDMFAKSRKDIAAKAAKDL